MEDFTSRFDVEGDARRVFDCVRDGGIAICHYDVSYAILSATDDALRRVYAAKRRSFDRASGVTGSFRIHDAVHVLSEAHRRMVRAVTVDHGLPLSVIAPFRDDDPFIGRLTPFLRGMATRDGTVNLLLNAGQLRDAIAELSWAAQVPLIGSSANASLQGTKYRVEDIEPQVLAAADIVIDYGPSLHRQSVGLSSTQIDFRTMKVVRYGILFDEIAAVFADEFGVVLPPRPTSAPPASRSGSAS